MADIAHQLATSLQFDKSETETINCDDHTYSYIVEEELGFICVTDASFGQSSAFLFLKYVKQLFVDRFGARGRATKLELDMNDDFSPILKEKMATYSTKDSVSQLDSIRNDMDEVKGTMQQNIGKILDRGDKIDLLVDKTDTLNLQSTAFAKSSKNLRRHLWLQNIKLMICGALVLAVLIGLVVYRFKKK